MNALAQRINYVDTILEQVRQGLLPELEPFWEFVRSLTKKDHLTLTKLNSAQVAEFEDPETRVKFGYVPFRDLPQDGEFFEIEEYPNGVTLCENEYGAHVDKNGTVTRYIASVELALEKRSKKAS
ncbi:hypothetical protein KAZ57_04005 [Patescibacteria group bacterium]|nr:hypothetical protein [Patescibacteria group bacterium]